MLAGQAETAARAFTDPYWRAPALAQVAEALAAAGQHRQATALASQAETAARTITNPGQQAQALARSPGR
jgi:hypothetical protein